jgi:hypothetical protein
MSNKATRLTLTQNELRELREEILNTTSREEKKEAKIIFDGKQYSIRFPKKFIEEAEIDFKKDFFEISLQVPEYASDEKPKISAKLIRLEEKQ